MKIMRKNNKDNKYDQNNKNDKNDENDKDNKEVVNNIKKKRLWITCIGHVMADKSYIPC